MEPWSVGLVAVVVVGLAVILYGALSDRARNRRAEAEMLAPPQRQIPHFRPDSPAPAYLSELQARRPTQQVGQPTTTDAERAEVARELELRSTVRIGAGYLSRDFVTDQSASRAVLAQPRVLVCADRVESIRELLGVLEKLVLSRTPLVVVATALSDEVRSTLEVNQIQGRLRVLAVVADAAELQRVAEATGAQVRERSDLQAGYVWPEHLGSCARWVSDPSQSYIVTTTEPPGR